MLSNKRKEILKVFDPELGVIFVPHCHDTKYEIFELSDKMTLPRRRNYLKYLQSKKEEKKPEKNEWKQKETPNDVVKRINTEREIELMHDTSKRAKDLFKKAREFDYCRHEMLFPSYKNSIESNNRNVKDVYKYNKFIYERELPNENVTGEKLKSVISDIHDDCEHKIVKRRNEALHDVEMYTQEVEKLYKRINELSNSFNEEKESQNQE